MAEATQTPDAAGGPGDPAERLRIVRLAIAEACARAGRREDEVTIIGVTKTVPVARVAAVRSLGLLDLGENRAADLASKAEQVPARWHFLGPLQQGSAHRVAAFADVVHSAAPGHGLARLSRAAERSGRTVDCLVQVDVTGRRHGVPPEGVADAATEVASLPGLRLVGLMTIPPMGSSPDDARPVFALLRGLREELLSGHAGAVELSMGMSADYPVAVEEGATMVRIGTGLFGPRPTGTVGETGLAPRRREGTS
jgi:PLP dependent protein